MNYTLMKLAVYAVRYSEPIEPFIQAYYDCSGVREAELCGTLSLTIVNNFGVIDHPTVKILNNVVRPDFSTGHLAVTTYQLDMVTNVSLFVLNV